MKPKKRFGQNFLQNKDIAENIVQSADIEAGDNVWEIGPGKGILTDFLLKHNCNLTCFEIDRDIIPYLKNKYHNKINLINKDILKIDWETYFTKHIHNSFPVNQENFHDSIPSPIIHSNQPKSSSKNETPNLPENHINMESSLDYGQGKECIISGHNRHGNNLREQTILVANIPYNITSPLLEKLCKHSDNFRVIVLMLQKEVADRISSQPKKKSYGVLSLKMQYYFEVKSLFTVKANQFKPQPKVNSMVVKLIPRCNIYQKFRHINHNLFWRIVECAFSSRRKTLKNNLKTMFNNQQIKLIEDILLYLSEVSSSKIVDSHNCIVDDVTINSLKLKNIQLPATTHFSLSSRGEELSEEDYIHLYNIIDIVQSKLC